VFDWATIAKVFEYPDPTAVPFAAAPISTLVTPDHTHSGSVVLVPSL
jgi:hypothetical protein